MKKEIIKTIIRDFHNFSLPKLFQRDLEIPTKTQKIISLIGVRRAGKTSIFLNLIKNLIKKKGISKEKIIYINFEDERLVLNSDDLNLILQAYMDLYPNINLNECYIFFDEIQNILFWEKFIRRIYDTVTKNIFITGSNSKFLSTDIATSLRGRTISYEIYPLSFKEYLNFNKIKVDLYSSKSISQINHYLLKYLNSGGFPELISCDIKLHNKILQEYFNVMIFKDLVERYKITNVYNLKYFLKRLFASATKQLSVNNIYNELKSNGIKIGKNQLYEYVDECQNVYLSFILHKYSEKIVNKELGEKKVYIIDNGLLNSISFKFSQDTGKLLEQLIFLELKRREKEIYFHKEKSECDFLIKQNGDITEAIQVSYDISDAITKKRELKGLMEACKKFNLKQGILISNVEFESNLKINNINIKTIPIYRWLLMPIY